MFFFGKKKKEKKQEQAVPVVNKEELIAKASEKVTGKYCVSSHRICGWKRSGCAEICRGLKDE